MNQGFLYWLFGALYVSVLSIGFATAAPGPLQRTDASIAASKLLEAMRQVTSTPYSFDRAGKMSGRTEFDERRWRELAVRLSDEITSAMPSTLDTQVVEEISEQLRDPYAWVNSSLLARPLGHLGPRAINELIEILKNCSDQLVRVRISEILPVAVNYIDKQQVDDPLVDNLTTLLDDIDPYVRLKAASALASLGARAVRAIPALERSLRAAEELEEQRAPGGFVGILSSDFIRNAISMIRSQASP